MMNKMLDKELKRNGSGYVDEPCYKAVTAPPRTGEIWIHAKSGAQMLVLANVNGVCPTLRLTETGGEGFIPVTGKAMMYVKPHMIGYCFDYLLSEYVKSVKGEEMAAIRKGIAKALGLAEETKRDDITPAIPHDLINELEEKNSRQRDFINALEEQVKTLTIERDKARTLAKEFKIDLDAKNMADKMVADSIAETEQEIMKLRIYKDMYMDLIGKLVSAKVGAVNE